MTLASWMFNMLDLALPEIILLAGVGAIYLAASILGLLSVSTQEQRFKTVLPQLISIAVVLEMVILIFRAVEIKTIPLTGSFESMMVLTIVFGLTYFVFAIFIQQPWFGAVMSWVLLIMVLITALVARPAAKPDDAIMTPWAIAHGLAMILGEVTILLSAVSAGIFLLANHRLKQKKITEVIGIVPNLELLQQINFYGISFAFVLVSLGMISGIGMGFLRSTALDIEFVQWLGDPKFIAMLIAWVIISVVMVSRHYQIFHQKTSAYLTLAAFLLILFAMVGISTQHDFQSESLSTQPIISSRVPV
jgi:ABC-type transport system involved in cytochrome c biogenesis permease subunit